MAKIRCLPDLKDVEISETELILEALRDAEIPITYVCGGNAQCSTCRILVVEGLENCTPPTSREQALTKNLGFPNNIRLACQTGVTGDVMVRRLVIDNEDIDIVESQLSSGSIGEEKPAAIIFAAIRGGADFDEVRFPYDVIYTMSRYFRRMNQIVDQFGGNTTSYMGNRFVALFDPESGESDAIARAVWAGTTMVQAVEELNAHFQTLSYQPLRLSIGIHYGSVLKVAIANRKKANSSTDSNTVLGMSVILANQIEAANRQIGTTLLVSDQVYNQVQAQAVVSKQSSIRISARLGDLNIYEITKMEGEIPFKLKLDEQITEGLPNRMLAFVQKFSSGWGKKK
jgi:adenylate cyclase